LYSKVYSLHREIPKTKSNKQYNETKILLSYEKCIDEITQYYEKTIGYGDWYILKDAIKKIKQFNFNRQKEQRLIEALKQVKHSRSVSKAKELCPINELSTFKRTLNELMSMGINPVTIPNEWGINHIPNLLTTYFYKVSDEIQENETENFLDIAALEYSGCSHTPSRFASMNGYISL